MTGAVISPWESLPFTLQPFQKENAENILLNYFKGMTQSLICIEAATICDGFGGPDYCTSEPLETKEGLSSRYPIRSSSTCLNDRTNVWEAALSV